MKREDTFLLKLFYYVVLACMVGVFGTPAKSLAVYSILHEFSGGANDGFTPSGSLTLSESTLYGMTPWGGSSDLGVIFKINTDGSGFEIIHAFTGTDTDGALPNGSLTLSGSTLYGVTENGGSNDSGGTLFSIKTDGTGFGLLHDLRTQVGDPPDGADPVGTPVLGGSVLYGMTGSGSSTGDTDEGIIYKINTDGTGYSVLHNFKRDASDGGAPNGSLILSGSTLYGTTTYGGNADGGTVFKINTDGSGYQVLHQFPDWSDDGYSPQGSLTLSGSTLFGMTSAGEGNQGVIFSIKTNGSGYNILHWFPSIEDDGANPTGSLTLMGSALYGMTAGGGRGGNGTLFQINTDGTDYKILHLFATDVSNDGISPKGDVTISNSILYGMTYEGGGSSHGGIVFSRDIGLWQDSTGYGDGWRGLSWFGSFNTNSSPWIYHETLGWLYPFGTSTDNIWFWDPQWNGTGGWWWTSSSAYPWIYSYSEGQWLYFDAADSTPGARWFFTGGGQASTH